MEHKTDTNLESMTDVSETPSRKENHTEIDVYLREGDKWCHEIGTFRHSTLPVLLRVTVARQLRHLTQRYNMVDLCRACPSEITEPLDQFLPIKDLRNLVVEYHGGWMGKCLVGLDDILGYLRRQVHIPRSFAGWDNLKYSDRTACLDLVRWADEHKVGTRGAATVGERLYTFDMEIPPGEYPGPPPLVRECCRLGLEVVMDICPDTIGTRWDVYVQDPFNVQPGTHWDLVALLDAEKQWAEKRRVPK